MHTFEYALVRSRGGSSALSEVVVFQFRVLHLVLFYCTLGRYPGISGVSVGSLTAPASRDLDDWLVFTSSEVRTGRNVRFLQPLSHGLVIVINEERLDLGPRRRLEVPGYGDRHDLGQGFSASVRR